MVRGSIDLLAEEPGAAPLVIDYKTDRLGGADPAELAERYSLQRGLYALAAAEATGAASVRVAYVFLERPEDPVVSELGAGDLAAARAELEAEVAAIAAGRFEVTADAGLAALPRLPRPPPALPQPGLPAGVRARRGGGGLVAAGLRGRLLEPRRELIQAQLLEALADRVQFRGAVGDQLLALAAEVEGLAKPGLTGVEPVDDLLEAPNRGLVALRLLAHPFSSRSICESSTLAPTLPSAKRSRRRPASAAPAALVSGSPSLFSARA